MTAESPAPAAPPSDPEPSSNSTTSSRATEASAPSPATGRWWIQAASYSDPDTAQAGRQRAEKQGFRVRLKEVRIEGKAWWRLQIGPYGDAAAAKTDIGAVEAAGFRGARAIER
ncbi:MAG: SPOR domain-containing protein [Algiphilus sp.]